MNVVAARLKYIKQNVVPYPIIPNVVPDLIYSAVPKPIKEGMSTPSCFEVKWLIECTGPTGPHMRSRGEELTSIIL